MSGSRRGVPPPLPPLSAVPRYRRLSALVAAAYVPPCFVGNDYNAARGRLWLRFQPGQTLPTAEEFEAAMVELYDMLRDAGTPGGVFVAGEQGAVLLAAKRLLDEALALAEVAGLPDA